MSDTKKPHLRLTVLIVLVAAAVVPGILAWLGARIPSEACLTAWVVTWWLGSILYTVVFLIVLWMGWHRLQAHGGTLSAVKAVGLCLVPLFQFYWFFVAIRGLARQLNIALGRKRVWYYRASSGIAEWLCILAIVQIVLAGALVAWSVTSTGGEVFGQGMALSGGVSLAVGFLNFIVKMLVLVFVWQVITAIEALQGLRAVPAAPAPRQDPPAKGEAIVVESLSKSYAMGRSTLQVLRNVSLRMRCGEFVSIVGASGSGKSTLLHLIGLLDRPDKGRILLAGRDVATLSSGGRNLMRSGHIGFVFQFYHLLGELSVFENVLVAMMIERSLITWCLERRRCYQQTGELLEQMGLADRMEHRSKELSGGERQRVAIARALINGPAVLLADEPTGNLDSKTGKQILDVLRKANKQSGQTILMVTHDMSLAEQSDRVLHLRDGRMAE